MTFLPLRSSDEIRLPPFVKAENGGATSPSFSLDSNLAGIDHPNASRIAANILLPDSVATGCFPFSSACSTNSAGSSLRKRDWWHGIDWPYFLRLEQWLIVN